jgi:hypothetical protein
MLTYFWRSRGEQTHGEAPADAIDGKEPTCCCKRDPKVLNGELDKTFRRWYPGFRPELPVLTAALKAAA